MSAKIIAFFNNKGGVGKTSLVYHLAWMYSDLGVNVLVADLDPQANLSAAFFDEKVLEYAWEDLKGSTIYSCVEPLVLRQGDVKNAEVLRRSEHMHLILGDLRLSGFEDVLATGWSESRGGQASGFVVMSSFWRIVTRATQEQNCELVLLDLGPNLGAINRAALLSADYLVVPLAADLFSLQGMKNLGPTVRQWKKQWEQIYDLGPVPLECPAGKIQPLGYVVQQHSVRLNRPVKSYERWMAEIPGRFRQFILADEFLPEGITVRNDPWSLGLLKHYHSLMPLAQEAHKPIFHLKVADGAIGAHFQAAQEVGREFQKLANRIAEGVGLKLPEQVPLFG